MPDRRLSQIHVSHAVRYEPICITLAVISFLCFSGGLLTTFGPLSRLRESDKQIHAINGIDNAITDLEYVTNRMLVIEYGTAVFGDFVQLENQFQSAVSAAIVLGLEDGFSRKLNDLNNETLPRFMILNSNLENLNIQDMASGSSGRSLIARSLLENQSQLSSLNSNEIVGEMSFLVTDFIHQYRNVTQEARRHIAETTEKAFRRLSISMVLYPVSLFFLMAIVALRGLRNARLAEIDALQRTEKLEELVRIRTFNLEQQNRELTEARSLLVEREKLAALGGLVAGVAHEVNTPLGIGVTAASFLADLVGDDPEKPLDRVMLKETSELILSNLMRASDLIRGFKRVAVDESGEMVRQFDLVEYLSDDLMPSLKPLLRKNRHKMRLSGVESLVMKKNPGDIARILTNLVINASIHGYGPEKPGIICIRVERDGNECLLIVSDSGKGMGTTTRNHMYDPFFTTSRKEGGSGLGLMLVYNLVNQKLNGRIDCETTLGKGSTFTVRFPI